ncbi:bifunctional diaminohydroxyphosphoribosylaminopyrimidine deaminase/5-amino-6-(5-phosphoribosylamino)uracil reductase RibD [Clostridium chauvoei]|uniref:bifunctional diaminohydroxyphosphoribosylaminopyrimidine deaminase/5-amino-6-(5-phosphoribosylamino)uracil reductase RibD n=1 Tax=Clostridium chauvoei TaxID=46867 RepID=UPI001C84A2E9|nr:bifunctional diaminohydroxyphosphoribosylaminopyrimidine deaminase/5-amino-6-(5-phosphoribosylamino)uracil reductase RibD [Clostridium chauvoei]MBX7288218.1 bifunctional diaminohydroxyphosphoribosylaminopyrimidine deaminase/5-amino-6-(5-phosphoribosylamino)uracil reductase RibD [Clostridium chauvoei]
MDEAFMRRALELAKKGEGSVNSNPLVGAVIVKSGKVIGEGYHREFGKEHAEINAIKNAKDNLNGADLYVTLEPCCHYGKTPPCVETIKKYGFRRVIIGTLDLNPIVRGKGIKILKEAGIEVVVGILEEDCRILNEIFNHYIMKKKPFVALKWAMTMDGKIATCDYKSKWITNEKSRAFVHNLRNKYKGIMVGINTILKDNPDLRCRNEDFKNKDHFRIILDSNLRIPLESKVLENQDYSKTIIFTTKGANKTNKVLLENKGIEVIEVKEKEGKINLKEVMQILGNKNIDSILVEGGGTLNFSLLKEGLANKIYEFISPKIFGGKEALTPVEGGGVGQVEEAYKPEIEELLRFDNDILLVGKFNN